MKLNMYNVFDDLPQENAQKINQNNVSFNCDVEIINSIKDKTLFKAQPCCREQAKKYREEKAFI